MQIKELIKENKEDGNEINVIIQDSKKKDFLGDGKEVFFGILLNIPECFWERDVTAISQVCVSSDPERVGANVLVVE